MENNDTKDQFSDILNSLMKDPKIGEMISAFSKNHKNDGEKTSDTDESASSPADFSLPPELLAKLPQVMSAVSGMGLLQSDNAPKKSDSGDKGKSDKRSDGQRKALLAALKPYLSGKRCAMIDGLLQLEGLAGILNILGKND